MLLDESDFIVNSIEPFLSSIIGNIVSNMAFHASENENAIIELYWQDNCIVVEFRNLYHKKSCDFNLGLDFCRELAAATKINLKFSKTKDSVFVKLKIPVLKNLKRQIVRFSR